jgi:hypothetical protein
MLAKSRSREALPQNGRLITSKYIHEGLFVVDLISIAPFLVQVRSVGCQALLQALSTTCNMIFDAASPFSPKWSAE